MAQDKTDEEKSFLQQAGDLLWDSLIWDRQASLGENLFWTTVSVGSLAAIPFTGGLSAGGVAASAGARTAARAGVKAAAKMAAHEAAEVAAKKGAQDTAEAAASASAKSAGGAVRNYLNGSPTRKATFAFGAAGAALGATPLLINKWENDSGGAVTETLLREAVAGVQEGIRSGAITRQNLEEGLDSALSLTSLLSADNVRAQTVAVMAAMGGAAHPSSEVLDRARKASVAWTLGMPASLTALGSRHYLRAAAAESLYGQDTDAKDLHLAQGLVQDVLKSANISTLKTHEAEVTENDVKAALREQMQKGRTEALFKQFPGLENGLRQMWPDLSTPKPLSAETAKTETAPESEKPRDPSPLSDTALSTAFDKAADSIAKIDRWEARLVGVLMDVTKGLAPLFNMLGLKDMNERFMRFSLGMAEGVVKSQFGDRFDLDTVSNALALKPKAPVLAAPAPSP